MVADYRCKKHFLKLFICVISNSSVGEIGHYNFFFLVGHVAIPTPLPFHHPLPPTSPLDPPLLCYWKNFLVTLHPSLYHLPNPLPPTQPSTHPFFAIEKKVFFRLATWSPLPSLFLMCHVSILLPFQFFYIYLFVIIINFFI